MLGEHIAVENRLQMICVC